MSSQADETVITTANSDTALVVTGLTYPDNIEALATYARLLDAEPLTESGSEGWQQLSKLGLEANIFTNCTLTDASNASHRDVYVLSGDWRVTEHITDTEPSYTYTMLEELERINRRFPESERLPEKDLVAATQAFYDTLSDADILSRRRNRRTAAYELYDYYPGSYPTKDAVMEAFDNCPGIKERLEAMGFTDTFEVTPDTNAHDFYAEVYPNDELGQYIDPDVTFRDLVHHMSCGDDLYDTIGVGDSLVRERTFSYMADAYGIGYSDIYYLWMGEETEDMLRALQSDDSIVRDVELRHEADSMIEAMNINAILGTDFSFEV